MRKLFFAFLLLGFLGGAVAPAFSARSSHDHGDDHTCGCTFTVTNPNHTQLLGGKSGHSSHGGLHKAAENSPVVVHNHGHGGH